MPQHYTVPTSNAFAALDDSDNEDAILSKPEEVPEPPKQATRPQVDSNKQRPQRSSNQQQQSSQTRSAPRTRRPDTPERESPAAGNNEDRATRPTGVARPAGGPRPVGRGGRFQRPAVRPGDRELDRHSGTGRGKEMKKGGAGAHNWGNESNDFGGDEAAASGEWPTASGAEGAVEGQEAAATALAGGEEQQKAAPAEEGKPKTQSYADYLASRQEAQAALPVREAAADEALEADRKKYIQDGYQIYTKENPRAVAEKESQGGDSGDEKQRPRTMHLAEVAEQSGQQLNYRGAQRGGRGGRNNGPQRANSKPSQQQQQQQGNASATSKEINLSDNQAFPTLQAH